MRPSPSSSDRLLARNTILNFGGQAVSVLAAVVAIPILINALGEARFAILTLVWAAIGYFSLFDFGVGRALTHAVAKRIGTGQSGDLAAVTWTALWLMTGLGAAGGVIVAVLTPLMVHHMLTIPPDIASESLAAFYLLAASLPLLLVTLGLRGVFEAYQDFGVATALRVPIGLLMYFGPVAVLPFSHSLVPIVAVLFLTRLAGALLHFGVVLSRYPVLRRDTGFHALLARPLLHFGGWMTVSNVISPLMVNMDRYMIGAILPLAAVAYYVTPYEAVTKLWIVPGALLGVLFPAFAATFATDGKRTAELLDRGVRVILVVVFPFTLVAVALAHEGLALWINPDFARQSAPVLQWLAIGVLLNCVGMVLFTAVQGTARPDLTAKLHIAELPLYLAAFWILARRFGLTGVAMAWVIRMVIDTAALYVMAGRQVPSAIHDLAWSARVLLALALALAAAAFLPGTASRLAGVVVGSVVFGVLAWLFLLRPPERALFKRIELFARVAESN